MSDESLNQMMLSKKFNFKYDVLFNRWFQFGFVLFMMAVITPLLVYVFVYATHLPSDIIDPTLYTCSINKDYQISCGFSNISEAECLRIDCCFVDSCYHRDPSKYSYKWDEKTSTYHPKQNITPYKTQSYVNLNITFEEKTENVLMIHIYDSDMASFKDHKLANNTKYYYEVDKETAGINVFRNEDKLNILCTNRTPLIASAGYWEITAQLTNETLFGFGQLQLMGGEKFIFYNNKNDHNRLPIVIAYKNGTFHGMYIKSSSLIEVTVLPSMLINIKSLTYSPSGLSLGVVVGKTPKEVVEQLLTFFGMRKPPPYWALGAHICRMLYLYRDGINKMSIINNSISEAETFAFNALQKEVPYESECIHENIFSLSMSTTDSENDNLINFIGNLQSQGKRFFLSFSPQIDVNSTAHQTASSLNLIQKDSKCKDFQGKYLQRDVVYPAFNGNDSGEWFSSIIKDIPGIQYADGIYLKDCWPLDDNNTIQEQPQDFNYFNQDILNALDNTIVWNSTVTCSNDPTDRHMENHNEYCMYLVQQFYNISDMEKGNGSEKIVLTSSYSVSNEYLVGLHYQNVNISWFNLKKMISETVFQGLFVSSMISTPVCGSSKYFDNEDDEELCIRWYITAATLPMFRISSELPRRDPFNLPTNYAQQAALDAIKKRYAFIPYFNTILQNDMPLVRPMFYEFLESNLTFSIDEQYMIGDSLLSTQIVLPNLSTLPLYLPEHVTWYEYWTGKEQLQKGWLSIFPEDTDWILYILGGHIIPVHDSIKNGTAESMRYNPFILVIALECVSVNNTYSCQADGNLHIFDDVFLEFHSNKNNLTITNVNAVSIWCNNLGDGKSISINEIHIYGIHEYSLTNQININLCNQTNDAITVDYTI